MRSIVIIKICDHPEYLMAAANWFSQIWDIPTEAYQDSMQTCIEMKSAVPQWYLVLDHDGRIIAGAGVIDNDFHPRKDLTPNLCALYVEEEHRGHGIARQILNFVRYDFGRMGYKRLYLITEHTEFYEKCGWDFLTMVTDDDGNPMRIYAVSMQNN